MTLDELKREFAEIDENLRAKLYDDGWMDINFLIKRKPVLIASIEVNSPAWIQIHSDTDIEPEIYFKAVNAFMKFANTKPEERGI
ncbi:hypothetical protein [uncultured Anaerococcus sp.]|uniref:hypothetical protein n=1 Tax=uncultured Anaerococcus sp. TaxID=293428 RepID=UPI00288B29A1|nr:hypothetical protein [uncultured Anaerococcus sp.]